MKIALVITVKNEARLLRNNVRYHRYIGVDRIFIFDDGSKDNTTDTIKDLEYCEIANSVDPDTFKDNKEISTFVDNAKEHHTARQNLNTFKALQTTRKENFDWLIALDADEFIRVGVARNCLKKFFEECPDSTKVVRFSYKELLTRKTSYSNVLTQEIFFKCRRHFPILGKRKIRNPSTKSSENFSYWFGPTMGKSAIRVQVVAKPKTTHNFEDLYGQKLTEEKKGVVLHYFMYDFQDFLKKFKNFEKHPDTFLSGAKIDPLRKLFRDQVNKGELREDELRNNYNENIIFGRFWFLLAWITSQFLIMFGIKPLISKDTAVKDFIQNSNESRDNSFKLE